MTPEELNAAHRDVMVDRLSRQSAFLKQLMQRDDPDELSRFVLEHGTFLSEHGFIKSSEAPRFNKMFIAAYRNAELEEWAANWSETVQSDERAGQIVLNVTFSPESVPSVDFKYLFDTYMSPTNVLPALEIMLRDADIRDAMGLSGDVSVEDFKRRASEFGCLANTYEEFETLAKQYAYFGPMLIASAFVFALALVFALTFVGPTPVTCTSGQTCLPSVERMVPPQGQELQSICVNESSKTLWVVVRGHSGFRRLALHPQETSEAVGMKRVEAIIVGGRGNDVTSVSLADGQVQTGGCYVIAGDGETPGIVTVVDGDAADVSLRPNEVQRQAEASGRAGYSSLDKSAIADYADERFAMDAAAALLPASTDRDRLFRTLFWAEKHARALGNMNWMKSLQPIFARMA